MADNNKREKCMSTIIRVTVLSWSAALLTASYAGLLAKMDPTFIATVFTAAAATFGVDTLKKSDKDDEEKSFVRTPEPELVIEPEPIVEPVVATEPCPTCGDNPDYTTKA
jgi:hypothetical protein